MCRINMNFSFRKPFPRRQPATTPSSPNPSHNRRRRHQPQRWVLYINTIIIIKERLPRCLSICLFGCCAPPTWLDWVIPHLFRSLQELSMSPNVQTLTRERKSNCCHPLHSSALMITPPLLCSRRPLWEFLSPKTLDVTINFSCFSWTWDGTWLLAERRVLQSRWRNTLASISPASNPDPSTCSLPNPFSELLPSSSRLKMSTKHREFACVSCHSPSNTWEWTPERVIVIEVKQPVAPVVLCKSQGEAIWGPKIV